MKKVFFIAVLFVSTTVFSQNKLMTKIGIISFESTDEVFNNVKATNNGVTCVLNPTTGEIAALGLVKEFRFKIALMEEHFNETYVESATFPKAIFRGNIADFDVKLLSSAAKEFTLNGTLELHGKTAPLKIILLIKKTASEIQIISQFTVISTDFGIKIPTLSKKSLTNGIQIKLNFALSTAK